MHLQNLQFDRYLKSKKGLFNENFLTITSLNASWTTSPKEILEVSLVLQIKTEG